MKSLSRLVDILERRCGRFAVRGLVSIVAGLQFLTHLLAAFLPLDAQKAFGQWLSFDAAKIYSGQVWRLFSHLLVPSVGHGLMILLVALIMAMFTRWLGRGLEQVWGAFRLNLYFLGGALLGSLGGLFFDAPVMSGMAMSTLLLAFAVEFPEEEILMFGLIPIKIRWLAWLEGAGIVLMMFSSGYFLGVLLGCMNFLLVYAPHWVAQRRQRQRSEAWRAQAATVEAAAPAPFHQCIRCGRSERDAQGLEFRVNAMGDEVCSECRSLASAAPTL